MKVEAAHLRRLRTLLALPLAGALAGWFHAPYNFWPLCFVVFPLLALAVARAQSVQQAFGRGWLFAVGYFVAGLYWIAHALFVDIAQFWWALPLAVLALPVLLALFWGAAAGLACAVTPSGPGRVVALAATLGLAEWLRGHVLTGFPWLLPAYMWVDVAPVRLMAAYVGAYGVSLWVFLISVFPALWFAGPLSRTERRLSRYSLLVLALLPLLSYLLPPLQGDRQMALRLVQPSIEQSLKLNPAMREQMLQRLLALTAQPGTPDLIIWPESAVPYLLDERADIRLAIASALPPGSVLATGAVRRQDGRLYNSVLFMQADGSIIAHYDKAHLVPFGEYIPVRDFLPFDPVAGGIDFTAGPGPRTVHLGRLPSVGALVCYEVLFPGHVADKQDLPQWLLNLTNDGWYGVTHGPYQHFALTRFRAVETGRPLVRVANTGVSGTINADGAVSSLTELGDIVAKDIILNVQVRQTLYQRLYDIPLFLACFSLLLILYFVRY